MTNEKPIPASHLSDEALSASDPRDTVSDAEGPPRYPMIVVAGVATLVYVVTVGGELVLDDAALIPHHGALQSPWDLGSIFTGRYWGDLHDNDTLYRPLVIWSLALNAGLNRLVGLPFDFPALYHVGNVVLHAIVSASVQAFAVRLGVPARGALVAGLLFAVHPIHTEAVASIVNRSELLSAAFGLGFLLLHLGGTRRLAAMSCLLMALFSKESAIAWLPLAAWIDLCLRRNQWPSYLGYSGVTVFWLGLRSTTIQGTWQDVPFVDNPLVAATISERIATALRVQFDYLQLQVWPVGLSADYSFNQIPIATGFFEPRVVAFVVVAASLAAAAWHYRERVPLLMLCLGGYAVLGSVTANILFPTGTIMAERLVYAPSLFVCVLAGYGCRNVRSTAAIRIVALVLLMLAALTVQRNLDWSTRERFYTGLLTSAPNSTKSHFGVAHEIYHPSGDLDRAIAHYLRAIEIHPDYADAWNDLGTAYFDRGDVDAAAQAYATAVRLRPMHAQANANLGMIFQQQGRLDDARRAYTRALEITPDQPQVLTSLALIDIAQGRPDAARKLLRKALGQAPENARARDALTRLESSNVEPSGSRPR